MSDLLAATMTGALEVRSRLLASSSGDAEELDEILVWGPSPDLPTSTWWWLLTPGPHSNTPVTLLMDLGTGLAVLGLAIVVVAGAVFLVLAAVFFGQPAGVAGLVDVLLPRSGKGGFDHEEG